MKRILIIATLVGMIYFSGCSQMIVMRPSALRTIAGKDSVMVFNGPGSKKLVVLRDDGSGTQFSSGAETATFYEKLPDGTFRAVTIPISTSVGYGNGGYVPYSSVYGFGR
jgi:hypothetical protein